jgi:acetyl-CoA carboxylase biotin carboxyl carrier protein
MSVDLRKIKKLIELVEESGISELEVSDGDESIRIARPLLPAGTAASASAAGPAVVVSNPGRGTSFEIRSPMPGTFYRAPAPDAGPFVAVGQAVQAGDVLCIIESMKMMNEVSAERAGVCVAAEVENGEAIGSGQVLFRFE